ncbi:MAG: ATP-binding protein, partial [Spirochaetes bacterium]|nr:ATP-binding protein [Spirochaetota bacterium]
LIHEKLYQSKNLSQIDFGIYIRDLVAQLIYSYNVKISDIKLTIEIDKIYLGVDLAIPCAQIINELVSNLFKYAFPYGGKGALLIRFSKDKKGKYTLIIGDNGIGLPAGMNLRKIESLGLKIVNSLTEQIKGKIEIAVTKGTRYTITF